MPQPRTKKTVRRGGFSSRCAGIAARNAARATLLCLLPAAALAALLAVSCSREATSPTPEETVVSMGGVAEFPDPTVDPSALTVALGDYEGALGSDGAFVIQGHRGAPGLAVVSGQDSLPMLMAIVPDPQSDADLLMDASSTALAMAFLCPFVCVNDPAEANEVLAVLAALPETGDLAAAIDAKLTADPLGLGSADEQIDALLTRVVEAYIYAYPSLVERNYPSVFAPVITDVPAFTADQTTIIEPSNTVSGHQVTYLGQDTFKLTNARGRWAYCLTPQEDFYAFPNGGLLDALRGRMWAPSQREFEIDFAQVAGDTAFVHVYGLGWVNEADNLYDDLSNVEKDYVLQAGGATVLFEFVPQLLSVLTNTSRTFLSAEIANRNVKLVLGFLKYGRIGDRIREYIRAGDPSGLVWYLTKEGVATIIHDNNFRTAYLEAIGLTLTDKAVARLACWVILPARVVLLSDSMTSALKTAYGFVSTRFRTTFKIYHEYTEEIDTGSVQGSVHDEDTGLAIEGVTVALLGDDDNPLHPAHQDFSSASGGYYFSNILTGEKTIRASKAGYLAVTITVTIVKDQTIAAPPIELARTTGAASGMIVDEILLENGSIDPRFVKPLGLRATEIGGDHRHYSYSIHDGDYSIALGTGTWQISAEHDDYFSDSLQVVIAQDQAVTAPRNLVMKPKSRMEGWIYLDMDNNGSFEVQEPFAAAFTGSRRVQPDGGCPSGGGPRELLEIRGQTAGMGDIVDILIDPLVLTGSGDHALGGVMVAGCSGYYPKAGASYVTNRRECHDPDYGYEAPLVFANQGMPEFAACDCGITDYGSLALDEYGSQLTDPIDGLLVAYLAGSRSCTCSCCDDVDGDGDADDWVVQCARARVEVHLRVLVGSLYETLGLPEE